MDLPNRNNELDAFKANINLCEYAASCGYSIDRKLTSRSSVVMRHENGDKLVIARKTNQHFVYFNVHDDRDCGTIIDFVQHRDRISLGETRKRLRAFQHTDSVDATRREFIKLEPCEHDAARVIASWIKARPIHGSHTYLERQRHIPGKVLNDPAFANRIRIDHRRNALFPHWNLQHQLCGFEIKNEGFTGFSPGGVKGLWASQPGNDDDTLVICETTIDAISFAALRGTESMRFVSTAGQISSLQADCLRSAVTKMKTNSRVILAMDHDSAGQKLADQVVTELKSVLNDRSLTIDLPTNDGDDWNDVLRRSAVEPRGPNPV